MTIFKKILISLLLATTLTPVTYIVAMSSDKDNQEESKETEEQFQAEHTQGEIPPLNAILSQLPEWTKRALTQKDPNKIFTMLLKSAIELNNPELVQTFLNIASMASVYNKTIDAAVYLNDAECPSCLSKDERTCPLLSNTNTPLMMGCSQNNTKIATMLLKAGANVNAKGLYDRTALMIACHQNNEDFVTLLLDAHADVNARSTEHSPKTALMIAAEKAYSTTIVRALLKAGAQPINEALVIACQHSNTPLVHLLLEAGADANAGKGAALLRSIVNTNKEAIKALLNHGAHPNKKYFCTCEDNTQSITMLIAALDKDDPTIVRMLLDAGADVNIQNERHDNPWLDKQTPLLFAIDNRKSNIVNMLLENNADVDQYSYKKEKYTHKKVCLIPLIQATQNKDLETVRLILERRPWLSSKESASGETASEIALNRRSSRIFIMLIAAGADITANFDKVNSETQTVMLAAAQLPAHMGLSEHPALEMYIPVVPVRSLISDYLTPIYEDPLLNTLVIDQLERQKKDNFALNRAEQALTLIFLDEKIRSIIWDYAPSERDRVLNAKKARQVAAQAFSERAWATSVAASEQTVRDFLPEDHIQRIMWSYIPEERVQIHQIKAINEATTLEEEENDPDRVACYSCGLLNKIGKTHCRSCNMLLPNGDGLFDL